MTWIRNWIWIIAATGLVACASPHSPGSGADGIHINITNPSSVEVRDGLVRIDLSALGSAGAMAEGAVFQDTRPTAFDYLDTDGDGTSDQLAFVVSVPASGTTQVTLTGTPAEPAMFPKRTHAELGIKQGGTWKDRVYEGGSFMDVESLHVPPEHTDHSFFIRYEGPGWESEKVGYRFYLDWRNGTDIFGKKKDALVLDHVGLDGFESYHEMADWGMDILKVGDALGVGALGCWSKGKALRMSQTDSIFCSIAHDGNALSVVKTIYSGWATPFGKADVISEISISAGSRLSHHVVHLSEMMDSLCTGIVKHPNTVVLQKTDDPHWNYLATWGYQSLADDSLGMVVFFQKDQFLGMAEDVYNHVIMLKPGTEKELDFYFGGCWDQEEHGIRTLQDFQTYLDQSLAHLNQPLTWNQAESAH